MHRDIKPDNFLLTKDCKVLLCDFGLSRLIDKDFKSVLAPSVQ